MAVPKRKPDTEALMADATGSLEVIERRQAELDANRLDTEPAVAIKMQIELDAARKDAEGRIAQLEKRRADELKERQVKAQAALIGRIETRLSERNEAIAEMCKQLAAAVAAMEKVQSLNNAVMAAWPWNGPRDNEPLIVGKFFRAAIRNELYRLSGKPFVSGNDPGGFDFPGSECPTPFGDVRPQSVKPLVERAREALQYATRIMREAPIRTLPPTPPPAPTPAPVEIKPNGGSPAAVATPTPEPENRKAPQPEYVYHVQFTHTGTGEARNEEVKFGPAELEEAAMDGLGGTGPRAQEIALRIASERVGAEFKFERVRFDANRLIESLNRD